jgi:hypothetical protein
VLKHANASQQRAAAANKIFPEGLRQGHYHDRITQMTQMAQMKNDEANAALRAAPR